MPSAAQEKRPAEVIRLGADFTQALLLGESVVLGNMVVTVKNLLTDDDATSTILVPASTALAGNVMTARVQAGGLGDVYEVMFKTGSTNFLNAYTATVNLVVTDQPGGDYLLCTLDQVKRALRIDATDTSDDATLMDMISSATRYVQSRTARTLFLQQFTEDVYIDECETERRVTQLWEYPVLQVDSITFLNSDGTILDTLTDSAFWGVNEEGTLFLRHIYAFSREPYFSRVVYRAGYGKIPDDLSQAAAGVASVLYRSIGREGLTRERLGDYSWQAASINQLPSGLYQELHEPVMEGTILHYTRPGVLR